MTEKIHGHVYVICACGRVHFAVNTGEFGGDSCIVCGRPAAEMRAATQEEIDALPSGVTVSGVIWQQQGDK